MSKEPQHQHMLWLWTVQTVDNLSGEIIREVTDKNLFVKGGRELALVDIFGLTASTPLIGGMVGASSTAANVDQDRLIYEHIGNATRKILTNTSDAALTAADVEDVVYVDPDSGVTFYKKLTVKYSYGTSDGNNGQPFREYGLNTAIALPATPTSLSGIMGNRLVDTVSQQKASNNTINIFCSCYT